MRRAVAGIAALAAVGAAAFGGNRLEAASTAKVFTPVGYDARVDLSGCVTQTTMVGMRSGQTLLLLNRGSVPVVITSDIGKATPSLARGFWHEVTLLAGTWHFTFKRPSACSTATVKLVVTVS